MFLEGNLAIERGKPHYIVSFPGGGVLYGHIPGGKMARGKKAFYNTTILIFIIFVDIFYLINLITIRRLILLSICNILNTFLWLVKYVHLFYLHSTLSVVLAVFGGVLLFEALHSKDFLLSVLFPVKVMEVVSVPAMNVMSVDPRYQVISGAGTALLLTTQRTSMWVLSLMVSGLSLGLMETL